MNPLLQKYHRALFYALWLLLSISQAAATELIDDEAYYWVYSKFLAWGYFDHPPMIALMIKCGYALFDNELGVRLLCVLMNLLTVLLVEKLIDKKNPLVFYSIMLSLGVLQIAGILAVPDTPLLFFTALFFYCYKNFLGQAGWKNTILLGLVMALLLYSKYHGILIILFTILSNPRLLAKPQAWLAVLAAMLFYTPHLAWQWEHNWESVHYHLFESNVNAYKLSHTLDYLGGQILLAGPLAGLLLIPAAVLFKPKGHVDRTLKFTLLGIYAFFFLSSFRGKVEANWTMPVLVPLIVLSHNYISERVGWMKFLRVITAVSLLLIIAGRIYLVMDIGPDNAIKQRFHYNKEWSQQIAERTGNYPVVFYNSYQRASRFWFYSGKPSHAASNFHERKNAYAYWPTDDSLIGKPVFMADVYDMQVFTDSLKTKKGWVGWRFISSYANPVFDP